MVLRLTALIQPGGAASSWLEFGTNDTVMPAGMSREESSFTRLLFASRAGKLRAMKALLLSLAHQVKLSVLDSSGAR